MLRIITDFDGPIVDVSERYYRVYQYCLEKTRYPGQITCLLSKEEFWQLKRQQVSEKRIGEMSGLDEDQARKFAALRRQTVHTLPYLVHDRPVAGAIETLELIQKKLRFDLVVMTMRRVVELDHALNRYDLGRFFPSDRRYCLSNSYVKTTDVKDKPLLMARALKELPPAAQTWMVGDTEADIAAAKSQNIKVIGVLSGIRDRSRLEIYEPDYIVNNLASAVDLIAGSIRAIG
ncbi:HAD family hydrolase [Pannus brasiliensis CCIBt3594]|uniref:HAD family hydrolase n=1 Tax=Pannus brasiliensis CCIBt3594 TaxID=1427578 RepID=A0AAW9QV98_9CHRO